MTQKIKHSAPKSSGKLRWISAGVLLVLIVIYVGLSVIYTQSNWPAKEVAGWFNYVISMVLVGLGMYELLHLLNIGSKQNWYLIALGIFLAEAMFIFPFSSASNQPLYYYLDLWRWLHWYVILLFFIVFLLGFFLLGYFTGSSLSGLHLMVYGALIVLGFKGFSLIALSLVPNFGFNSIIFAWGIVILTDSFAYFGGKAFGKHKMAPSISPNKTWEGAAIGTSVAVIIATLYAALFYYLLPDFAPLNPMLIAAGNQWVGLPGIMVFLLAVLLSIAGQLGDLAFSLIKRVYDQKDFSNLIPGHGGILDRFDSFIMVFMLLYFLGLSTGGMGVI